MQKKGLIILLLLFPVLLFGQGMKIKGKLVDTSGEPLIGANVMISSLSIGAATNYDGEYQFDIPSNQVSGQEVKIKASYIGYKSKEESVVLNGGTLTLNFTLEEDIFKSEEVIVTGIATRNSKAVAEVAVSRISAKELATKQNYQSISQLVSGKISGVNVQTTSGNVGSGWRFIMRGGGGLNGDGQPLIFIDGVKIETGEVTGYSSGGQSTSMLTNLNVDDIENMEILKGPAASAMYGTDASNGVVLITTKSGSLAASNKSNYSIDYRFNYGINELGMKFDEDKYLGAKDFHKIMEPNGHIREHSISVTGGSKTLRYYTSFQNRFESGIIPSQNHMDRTNAKLNLTIYPSEKLTFKLHTSYVWNKIRRPTNDNSIYGWMLNTLVYYPAYSRTDSTSIAAIDNRLTTNQFIGGGKFTYTPIKELEITGEAGLDYSNVRGVLQYPYGFKVGSKDYGRKGIWQRDLWNMSYNVNARYSYEPLSNLKTNSVVGVQLTERRGNSQDLYVEKFANKFISDMGSAEEVTGRGEWKTHTRTAGIYNDNQFNYKNTYMFSAGFRYDYASAVGIEAPSIVYPQARAAVRLDKLFELPSALSMFKVRVAYGESGQLPDRSDSLPLTWSILPYGAGLGTNVDGIGNDAIEPERVKEWEFGFDAEFLKIFSFEFTHWRSDATKSIINVSMSPSSGLGAYSKPVNIGSVEAHGFESMLQINPIRTADYDLSLSLIWNYQTNEVKSLGDQTDDIQNYMNVIKPGLKKHEFYDEVVTGAKYDADGKYAGVNVTADKQPLGNPIPDHSGSISVNFRFLKNFTFSAFGEFGFNNRVFSYTIRRMATTGVLKEYNDLRAQLGLTSKYPEIARLTPGTDEYVVAAEAYAKKHTSHYSNYIYDADYFVLREMNLAYDFTDMLKEHLPGTISSFMAGFSVRNVAKWSKYDLDFEVNYAGGRSSRYGTDMGTMPQARTYNFWIKCGF